MNYKQKQTIYNLMRKSLRKEYFYLKRELLLYFPVHFGTFPATVYYATFDLEGMSIYKYDNQIENHIRLVHRYSWTDWSLMKVDHLLQTSQFFFQGKQNLVLYAVQDEHNIVQFIQQHTSIEIETMTRPFWRKLPGYHYNTPMATYITSIFYTLFLSFLLRFSLPYEGRIVLFSISLLFMLLGILFLTVGLIDPSIVIRNPNKQTRLNAFYYYSYFSICGFICIFIYW